MNDAEMKFFEKWCMNCKYLQLRLCEKGYLQMCYTPIPDGEVFVGVKYKDGKPYECTGFKKKVK